MNLPASGAAYRLTMPAEPAAAVSSWNSGSSARVPFAVASTTAWAPSASSATTAQSPSITQPPELASPPQSRTFDRPASAASASLTWTTKTTSGVFSPRSTAATAARSPSHGSMSSA